MNRFLLTYCYSFAHGSILALSLFGLAVCVVQAQDVRKKSAVVRPMDNNYLRKHDLEVSSFSGMYVGKNIELGGQIKNLGPAAYPGGREILLYVDSGKGGWIPKGSAKIPALQVNETWPTPTFKFAANSVPTSRFLLFIPAPALDRDANYKNDEKKTDVTGVR